MRHRNLKIVRIANYPKWPDWPDWPGDRWPDWPNSTHLALPGGYLHTWFRPAGLTRPSKVTRQIFPPDRIREGWCKSCKTCEIANLQFQWVSESHTIIRTRDASASENLLSVGMMSILKYHLSLNGLGALKLSNEIWAILMLNTNKSTLVNSPFSLPGQSITSECRDLQHLNNCNFS